MWKLRSGEGCKLSRGHSEVKLTALSLIPSFTEQHPAPQPCASCLLLKWNEPAQNTYVMLAVAPDPSRTCVLS